MNEKPGSHFLGTTCIKLKFDWPQRHTNSLKDSMHPCIHDHRRRGHCSNLLKAPYVLMFLL